MHNTLHYEIRHPIIVILPNNTNSLNNTDSIPLWTINGQSIIPYPLKINTTLKTLTHKEKSHAAVYVYGLSTNKKIGTGETKLTFIWRPCAGVKNHLGTVIWEGHMTHPKAYIIGSLETFLDSDKCYFRADSVWVMCKISV